MKILYFSRSYTAHDHRFLSAIVEGGHKTFFLPLENKKPSERRPLPKNVRQLSGSPKEVIAKIKPDLIHAGPLTDCGYQVARSGFHPFIAMSWGSDILWEAQRNSIARKRVRFSLNHADLVIGDCQSVKTAVLKTGVPKERIVTFPWGVDLEKFHPKGDDGALRSRLGWQTEFVILHLRAWEALYDPMTVVRAFVGAAHENPRLRLLIPGSGSLQTKIKREIEKAGMKDRVHFPGQISQMELPNYFHAADIYLSASLSDGSSVSLMEALACGIPALVSDIPGNREWVEAGKQGWLFPVKNANVLRELILRSSVSKKSKDMGAQARKAAEQRADWRKNKQELDRAYELAMESAR